MLNERIREAQIVAARANDGVFPVQTAPVSP